MENKGSQDDWDMIIIKAFRNMPDRWQTTPHYRHKLSTKERNKIFTMLAYAAKSSEGSRQRLRVFAGPHGRTAVKMALLAMNRPELVWSDEG